jgi:hypothetical protein
MSPVNAIRAGAEGELGRAKATHGATVLSSLVSIVCDESLALDREMEWTRSLGVLLLKGITQREVHLWGIFGTEEFKHIRSQLLSLLLRESQQSRVRRLLIITLAALARVSPWNELMACVGQLSTSAQHSDRRLGMSLLDKLAEYVGPYLIEHLDSVTGFVCPVLAEIDSLSPADPDVIDKLLAMSAAAQACCSVIHEMSDDVMASGQHPLCLHILHAARVGRVLADMSTGSSSSSSNSSSGVIFDASSLAEEVFSSITLLACENPRAFQQVFPAMTELAIVPVCMATGVDNTVKSPCVEIATALLTEEESIHHYHPQLREQYLNVITTLATVVDTSDYSSEEEAVSEFFGADVSGESFFDETSSEEDKDDNLTCLAISCLESMADTFEPEEVVRVCLLPAFGNQGSPYWKERRAVALLASIVAEGAADAIQRIVADIVPRVLALVVDPHPRVRFTALRCLENFIKYLGPPDLGTGGMEEDEDDDDGGGGGGGDDDEDKEPAFRVQFQDSIPNALCAAIQQNTAYTRITHAAMHCARVFFDPDRCPAALCTEGTNPQVILFLYQHCVSLLRCYDPVTFTCSQQPLYMVEEAASLVGNLFGTFIGADVLGTFKSVGKDHPQCQEKLSEYSALLAVLRDVVGSLSTMQQQQQLQQSQAQMAVSALRCRCLESMAIIGRSVGRDIFRPDAVLLLNELASVIRRGGLDYSDPLASYICQACVRIAGVLMEEFEPYVSVCVPALLSFLEAEDDVKIANADDDCLTNGGGGGSGGTAGNNHQQKTDTVYKRGEGMVSVTHNPHQVREKLMACRILYQYTCDIPMFLGPYLVRAVHALVALTDSLVFDEEGALVVATAVSDLVRMYAEEKEDQGEQYEMDEQAYQLLGLVDALLEQLSGMEMGGDDVLYTLGNCLRSLAPFIV